MNRLIIFLLLCCFCYPAKAKNIYDGMTLMEFVNHVSERLELTIAFGERVKTQNRIKVFVAKDITDEKLYDVFETVLGMQNYIAISHDGIVRIVRERKARSSPIPVVDPPKNNH